MDHNQELPYMSLYCDFGSEPLSSAPMPEPASKKTNVPTPEAKSMAEFRKTFPNHALILGLDHFEFIDEGLKSCLKLPYDSTVDRLNADSRARVLQKMCPLAFDYCLKCNCKDNCTGNCTCPSGCSRSCGCQVFMCESEKTDLSL